jgi:hypothetical protein
VRFIQKHCASFFLVYFSSIGVATPASFENELRQEPVQPMRSFSFQGEGKYRLITILYFIWLGRTSSLPVDDFEKEPGS